MLGNCCLRILTETDLRLTSASMTLRAGGEGMIVSRLSRVGVSVFAIIKGDDGEVGGRGALLTALEQSETLAYITVGEHYSREYATGVKKSQS